MLGDHIRNSKLMVKKNDEENTLTSAVPRWSSLAQPELKMQQSVVDLAILQA